MMRVRVLPVLAVVLVLAVLWAMLLTNPPEITGKIVKQRAERPNWYKVANITVEEGESVVIKYPR